MAFTDNQNKRIWWDDISLYTGNMPQDFKDALDDYKKYSEIEKDKIENQDDNEPSGKTLKQVLRSV